MGKIGKKFITTILVVIGTLILYSIIIMGTIDSGKKSAPAWSAFIILGGGYAVIHIWATGWKDKPDLGKSDGKDKDDLLKL